MPQHKSAKRRMRTSVKSRVRNRMYKSRIKTLIKNLRGSTERPIAEELYKKVSSILDRYATKGVIHSNNAANQKSKLAKFVHSLG